MIIHPLSGFGGADFETQEIVDADGGYGDADYPAFYEASGDFGTLGEEGIYDDENEMGFSIKKYIRKAIKKPVAKARASVKKSVAKAVPKAVSKAYAPIQKKIAKVLPMPVRQTVPVRATAKAVMPVKTVAKSVVPVKIAPKSTLPAQASSVAKSQVVSTGGQLSVAKLDSAEKRAFGLRQKLMEKNINPDVAHPMLAYSDAMSGFLDDLWKQATTQIKTEAQKAAEKAKADLQARAGAIISSTGSKILAKPQVQAAIKSQAKDTAIQTIAKKIADPEVQKKAAIGGAALLAGIGALAFLAMRKK